MKTTKRFEVQLSQLRKEQDGFCDYSETIASFDTLEEAVDFAEDLNYKGVYGDFEPTDEHDYGIDVVDTDDRDNIVHQTSL